MPFVGIEVRQEWSEGNKPFGDARVGRGPDDVAGCLQNLRRGNLQYIGQLVAHLRAGDGPAREPGVHGGAAGSEVGRQLRLVLAKPVQAHSSFEPFGKRRQSHGHRHEFDILPSLENLQQKELTLLRESVPYHGMGNTAATALPHLRLKELVEERGSKRIWVAERLGITPSHLTRILSGERAITPALAQRAGRLFGVPASELIGGNSE